MAILACALHASIGQGATGRPIAHGRLCGALMRTTFVRTLIELAGDDDRLWLVAGDLGYSVLEAFSEKYPQRYLNAGVAEQNMTGIAAGLATAGKTAFTYSIANFPVF